MFPLGGLGFLLSSGRVASHFSKGSLKVEERLGFGRGNSEIIEGVTKMEVWVAFYRGKVTFWLAMVGERVNA